MARSNIANVVAFEVSRTMHKPGFWIGTLLMPLVIVAAVLLSGLSSLSAADQIEQQAESGISFEYHDASGLVDPAIAGALGGVAVADPALGLSHVKEGSVEAFFAYPANLLTEPVQVAGQDAGLFGNSKYASLSQALLRASVEKTVGDPVAVQVLTAGVQVDATAYRDGQETAGLAAAVIPALFGVALFMIFVSLGNQILAAFLEEKENRVAEMILTTISPASLLYGKLISLVILGLTQILVLFTPSLIALSLTNALPFGSLEVDPPRIALAAGLLLGGFALYLALVMTVGMIVPTVQESGPLLTVVLLSMVMPLYMVMLIISSPGLPVVQVLTYFPLTAPVTALVRNAVGTLPWWQGLIAIAVLLLTAALVLRVAIQVCRYGLISYTKKLNLRAVLGGKRVAG